VIEPKDKNLTEKSNLNSKPDMDVLEDNIIEVSYHNKKNQVIFQFFANLRNFTFNKTRKGLILAIVVMLIIALIISCFSMFNIIKEFIPYDGISHNIEIHNNQIFLNLYRLNFFILLIFLVFSVSIMLCLRKKLEYIYLTAALFLGVAYIFSITPLSAGDEHHHYISSYVVSGYILFEQDPFIGSIHHFDFNRLMIHQNTPMAYLRLFDEGFLINKSNESMFEIIMPETYTLDYPIFYLPQALGISIARIIGFGFFGVFYLGRFFNLLFYVFCVTFSIKKIKAFKLPLFLVGLLPMSLHQAASFSNDTFIFGVSMLFIAYAINCIYENDTFKWRDYFMLLILGVLLAPAKIVYLPIVFLIFLVAWKWRETLKWKAWVLAASIIIASTVMIAIFMGTSAVEIAGEQKPNWEGGYNYTLSFIIENPLETVKIFLRSIYHMREWYFYSMFGEFLSGLTLLLPRWYIRIMVAFIVAGIIYGKKDEWQPSWLHKGAIFMICAAVVILNMTAMFLGWTSDWHTVVLGIQGRYFIPILPLALILLKNKFTLISKMLYRNFVVIGFILMQCAAIVYILNYTLGLYG